MKKVKMELIDRRFSQKIADKYTTLQLFSTNFAPIISKKRIIPRTRWLELIYAMLYLVLRREIFNKYITTRLHRFPREIVTMQDTRYQYPASFYYVNLVKSRGFYFKSSSMELAQPLSHGTSTTRIETEKESAVKNYQLPVVMRQPPVVSHKPSTVSNKNLETYILSSTSDFITPLFSYHSFKPAFFLSQKAAPVKQRGASSTPQKSDAAYRPYGYLEREALQSGQKIISYFNNFKTSSMELAQPVSHETSTTGIETEKEPAFTNYQLPVVTTQPPVVSHKSSVVSYRNLENYILTSTSDVIAPLFSYYSFKPAFFLSQKTVPVKQREVLLNLQKSDAALHTYGLLERDALQNGQKIISYFNFKTSSMELAQPVNHETSTTIIETEKEPALANYQLPVVTTQPPVVSHKPSTVSNRNRETYILTSTSDFIAPVFSYYSFKPAFFLSQKTVPVKQREVLLNLQKSDAALHTYGLLERDALPNGQKISSQLKLSSMELAHPVSPENTSEVEKAPIYHTYPEIEHVSSTHTEIIKERVIEKEEESKPPHATPQLTSIDVNSLADQVYSFIERKIRIEKERRGLYG